jgi:hypothetical protein
MNEFRNNSNTHPCPRPSSFRFASLYSSTERARGEGAIRPDRRGRAICTMHIVPGVFWAVREFFVSIFFLEVLSAAACMVLPRYARSIANYFKKMLWETHHHHSIAKKENNIKNTVKKVKSYILFILFFLWHMYYLVVGLQNSRPPPGERGGWSGQVDLDEAASELWCAIKFKNQF